MTDEEIEVVYRVRTTSAEVGPRAEALLLEQTVELPRSALPTPFVREHLVGRIVATLAVGEGDYRVTLAQPALAAAADPAQLLNVLFGNCSLQPDVELEDVRLPPSLVRVLGGPRFGIPGLRQLAGVDRRALTASVLKPVGLSVSEIAALCGTLALSGLDIVKDDHGLADHSFSPFEDRVRACLAAAQDAAQKTGKRTLYVPNLMGTPATVLRQARLATQLGAAAVMVSPMLLGLPFLTELASDLGVPILAHPAFGGSLRIAPAALLGKLFPLFGADGVIYPNVGGRFSFSRDVCLGIAAALRKPVHAIHSAFPVPAGGMRLDSLSEVLGFYGADTILLVGGSILNPPGLDSVLARSQQFVASVHAYPYSQ
jgi:ribulose-bisphosphate carboxylase large chain